jgi:hypothetical protein
MNRVRVNFSCVALSALVLTGCSSSNQPAPAAALTTQPLVMSTPIYWLRQEPVAGVVYRDFDRLWNAAEGVAREYLFSIDRTDYRGGLLTTDPMISKQFFEFWRKDVATADDLAESSLATVRRTLRFEFEKSGDGSFVVSPKVLIERYTLAERRLTAAMQYQTAFNGPQVIGSREADIGRAVPAAAWYATGRDYALERKIAESLQNKLH